MADESPFFSDPSVVNAAKSVQGSIAVSPSPFLTTSSSPATIPLTPQPLAPTVSSPTHAAPTPVAAAAEESERNAGAATVGGKLLNYPDFPKWMRHGPIKPCYYVNIQDDIPVYGRHTVAMALRLSQGMALAWMWNFLCNLISLACSSCKQTVPACILSAFLCILFVPGSFICWFQPLYSALHKDSSLRFGWFFFTTGFQILICILFTIGVPGSGGAGFWLAADVMHDSVPAGMIILTSGFLWLFLGGVQALVGKRVLHIYRTTGPDTATSAGEEMEREVMANETVQSAAKTALLSVFTGK